MLPPEFSVAEEAAAFALWLNLSKAEARQVLRPSESNRCDMEDLRDEYNSFLNTLRKSGWTYDAQSRCYRQWSNHIDVRRAPFWFDFAPQREPSSDGSDPLLNVAMPVTDAATIVSKQVVRGEYALKIISRLTQKFPETVSVLSSRLLRRYHGETAAKAVALTLPAHAEGDRGVAFAVTSESDSGLSVSGVAIENVSAVTAIEASDVCPAGNMGRVVNAWISAACGSGADLIIMIRGTAGAQLVRDKLDGLLMDNFVPVYPLFLSADVLVITPILLIQLNGCTNDAFSSLSVFQSLYSRMRCILGAYLHNPSSATGMEEVEMSNFLAYEEDSWYRSGLRNEDDTLDGRFHVLELGSDSASDSAEGKMASDQVNSGEVDERGPSAEIRKEPSSRVNIASHVAWCQHGWCSVDTRVGLKTAITHYKPKVILELGSWYGKSSRFMLDFIEPGTVLFCADYYKNNAIYEHLHSEVAGEDKMFFNFPRYESFIAGIESKRDLWKDKPPCTVITVKMNIHDIIPYLHSKGFHIDMVFIDAEKKTDPLYRLVTDIHRRYPGSVIVGDDNVFQSVKTCVKRLVADREEIISMEESYVALPKDAHDRRLVSARMDEHRSVIDVKNKCAKYVSNLFDHMNDASLSELEALLFPDGAAGPIIFGDLAFVHDKDNGHCIAMQVISRAMKIIQKKGSPLIPKLTDLVLQVMERVPNAIMTEGRVTCFDYIARNIGFE